MSCVQTDIKKLIVAFREFAKASKGAGMKYVKAVSEVQWITEHRNSSRERWTYEYIIDINVQGVTCTAWYIGVGAHNMTLLLYVTGLMKYKLFVGAAAGKIEFKYSWSKNYKWTVQKYLYGRKFDSLHVWMSIKWIITWEKCGYYIFKDCITTQYNELRKKSLQVRAKAALTLRELDIVLAEYYWRGVILSLCCYVRKNNIVISFCKTGRRGCDTCHTYSQIFATYVNYEWRRNRMVHDAGFINSFFFTSISLRYLTMLCLEQMKLQKCEFETRMSLKKIM